MQGIPRSILEPFSNRLMDGERIRVRHDCGNGDTLIVSRTGSTTSAYCFRCGERGFFRASIPLAERLAALAQRRTRDSEAIQSVGIPSGIADVQQWPKEPRVWLYRAGFSNDDIQDAGFLWSSSMQRVIMPCFVNGRARYWQARAMQYGDGIPKVLNPSADRRGLRAEYTAPIPTPCPDVLVFTEDILSALKVSRVCDAWALLGTKADDSLLLDAVDTGKRIVLMLDSDTAGRTGARVIAKRLALMGVKTDAVYFGQDPKLISRKEILCRLTR